MKENILKLSLRAYNGVFVGSHPGISAPLP